MAHMVQPSPYGGWNARDALSSMASEDAVELVNLVPTLNAVRSRKGTSKHTPSALGAAVETLVSYEASATPQLLCAYGDSIGNVTSGAPAVIASGFTSARWQTNPFKDLLIFCNGADTPQVYDGSVMTPLAATGPTPTDRDIADAVAVSA